MRKTILWASFALALISLCYLHWDSVFKLVWRVPIVSAFVKYYIPPSDFHGFIADLPLQPGITVADAMCKYEARYEVDIIDFAARDLEQFNLKVQVRILDAAGNLLYDETNTTFRAEPRYEFAYFGRPRFYYSFICASCEAPKVLPIGQPLHIEVTCEEGVDDFIRQNPRARIVFQAF